MDIITHATAGAVAGVALSGPMRLSPVIILTGIAGALLPDIDAVSLWSGFDKYMAPSMGIDKPGWGIYFSKYWYSHRGFFHSIAAAALFTLAVHMIVCFRRLPFIRLYRIPSAFFTAYSTHLYLDYHTPGYVWGGINLFWPMNRYSGGTGRVWWWNNYDIFLILLFTLAILLFSFAVKARLRTKYSASIRFIICAACLSFITFQIYSRSFRYDYKNFRKEYIKLEERSVYEQKRILPAPLFNVMKKFDSLLPVNF